LKPDVSAFEAEAELAVIADDLARQYLASNLGRTVTVTPLFESMVGSARPALLILLGTVAFVLLIACANLANLLLARSTSRRKEIAVRQALGASRFQLMRQLMIESLVLAVVGGGVGLMLARWAISGFMALGVGNVPRADGVGLDTKVLLFTMVISLATGIVFGVGPALYATRAQGHALKEGGRGADGSLHQRAQQALVASEVALATTLLVGAGLLIKSFWRLEAVDPGFRPSRVLTLQTALPLARYPEPTEMPFYRRLEESIRPLPGVDDVAAVNILPLGGNYSCEAFDLEDRPAEKGRLPCAESRSITPDYFRAMGIRLTRGRSFTLDDTSASPPVVIVSDRMAEMFWPGQNPIGARILTQGATRQVVGVVGAVRHFGLDQNLTPEMYTPHAQQPSYHMMTLVVRASTDPVNLINLIRRELSRLDPDVPISNIRSMEQVVGNSTAQPRFRTWLLATFAGLALLLSVVGVAGVIAYSVSRRTHEIGVRVALGATGNNVISLLMRQGMVPTGVGVALGAAGSLAFGRVMSGLLFGVTATDSSVFAVAALALICAAALATYLPARRATSIDPMIALRSE
jgi:putative ABC transport system permease protein